MEVLTRLTRTLSLSLTRTLGLTLSRSLSLTLALTLGADAQCTRRRRRARSPA